MRFESHEEDRYGLQNGDLVICEGGEPGRCAIWRNSIPGMKIQKALHRVRVKVGLDSEYLYYWFLLAGKTGALEGYFTGTTIQHLTGRALAELKIPCPPIQWQRSIGGTLETLDYKIELNRRTNETLEAMAQSIFRDWFVDFGPVRRKLAGATDPVAIMGGLMPDPARAEELAGLFPDALNDEGVPVAWPKRCVTDVATVTGGKQLDKAEIQDFGPNPVFGGGGVMGFSTRSNADDFVITVGRVGAYCGQFFCHRGLAWVNNNASLIRPNAGVSAEWLLLNLRATDIDSIKRGAAQPFVSNGDVGKIELSGSETVASAFAEIVGPLFLAREQRDSENRTLAETRDYLLPRLMSGEVRVLDANREIAA